MFSWMVASSTFSAIWDFVFDRGFVRIRRAISFRLLTYNNSLQNVFSSFMLLCLFHLLSLEKMSKSTHLAFNKKHFMTMTSMSANFLCRFLIVQSLVFTTSEHLSFSKFILSPCQKIKKRWLKIFHLCGLVIFSKFISFVAILVVIFV